MSYSNVGNGGIDYAVDSTYNEYVLESVYVTLMDANHFTHTLHGNNFTGRLEFPDYFCHRPIGMGHLYVNYVKPMILQF